MNLFNTLKSIYAYSRLMGLEWFLFRIKYEIRKRSFYFDRLNNKILKKVVLIKSETFFYTKVGLIKDCFRGDTHFIKKADGAIEGKIFAFSHHYLDYSENSRINWHMNPVSKVKADNTNSWNALPDFADFGDIKLIWEASRFPQVYYFINAYAVTKDEKYAKACVSQITDWIEGNPYPRGVNYKCGQEISFRIFSWINAMEYFKGFISKDDEIKIVKNIYTSLLRINVNIDYAVKSVKNNHSISEAAGLFIGGLLFPQFKESQNFIDKGLKYLLKETSYQVYDDGAYIQHSFTYQRLVLDLLSYTFLVADKKQFNIPKVLRQRHHKMLFFLNAFMQKDGWLPNYGSNDGANLFPCTNSDYRDFRTSLNFAMGKSDFFDTTMQKNEILTTQIEFNDGGYYILKNDTIFSFIRCHSYRDRPASNDMFHLDIWYKGKNIFCDTGSYSYNTDKSFKNNFIGVVGHNTVMINDTNQMAQVLNFGYSNWTKAKKLEFDRSHFLGENYAYEKEFDIVLKRDISLDTHAMVVTDVIKNISQETKIKQIWNTKSKVVKIDKYSFKIDDCVITSNIPYRLEESYISDYYNSYIVGSRIIFEIHTDNDFKIHTKIEFRGVV